MSTVREVTYQVLRHLGMTRIFGNPGSTELPFLRDMPSDFKYVLALHERSAAGMALGYALGIVSKGSGRADRQPRHHRENRGEYDGGHNGQKDVSR